MRWFQRCAFCVPLPDLVREHRFHHPWCTWLAFIRTGPSDECECPVEGHMLGCERDDGPIARLKRALHDSGAAAKEE